LRRESPDSGSGADCYDPKDFNDKVVLIAITNYGVNGVVDNNFYSHYSLLKTIEAAFDLPFIGHAKDAGTKTRAAAGACVVNKPRRRDWKTSRSWALEGFIEQCCAANASGSCRSRPQPRCRRQSSPPRRGTRKSRCRALADKV
jgi:Phosphoesterase family